MKVARLLALALALVCAPATSFAADSPVQQYLSSANMLYAHLEYERALEQVRRARGASPAPAEAVSICLLEGALLFELGDADGARGAFLEALSLDPKASLPWKVSPKLSASFEGARVELGKRKPASHAPPVVTRSEGLPATRIGAIVGFVGAAAAAAGGVACVVEAKQRYDSLDKGTARPADAAGARDSGKQLQVAAGVLLGASAAMLATGAILWAAGAQGSAPSVSATLGPGGAQVVLSGVWP